jgi:hypothetical protein
MAQVTLYLSDDLEKRLKREARRAKKSLSAFISELALRKLKPEQWPAGFEGLYGSWQGDFPTPEDPPPEEREKL